MSRYLLKTLGCKANLYDSQILERELQKKGWSAGEGGDADLCIINSCTVTDEADKQTKKLAKKLARENPNAKIVVTGCGAEVDPDGLAKNSSIHYVVGNQDKDQLVPLVTSHILSPNSSSKILGKVLNYQEIRSRHPMDREWPAISDAFQLPVSQGETNKTRAFLKVQEGCDSFCTYCIIPYGRGPNRSLRPQQVIRQIELLIEQGVREVVITGTNIGEYGTDWSPTPCLDDLLEMILSHTSLERLRVSSLDPTEITQKMLDLMAREPRFCPHFHISLQSPSSKILKLMKRKYDFSHVESCLNKIEELSKTLSIPGGIFVGMDLITGFPGESEEEFEWGRAALERLPWSRLHVFPYSERTGTPATKLPHSVPQHRRVERARILNQLSLARLTEKYRQTLETIQGAELSGALLEKGSKDWVAGYLPNYYRVLLKQGTQNLRNEIVAVRPIEVMVDSQGNDVAWVC